MKAVLMLLVVGKPHNSLENLFFKVKPHVIADNHNAHHGWER